MPYHTSKIEKGTLGEFSKIQEEYEEFLDARKQNNSLMSLIELTDLIGAIEAYTMNHFNIDLDQLIIMTRATQSAFKDGTRK